MAPGTALLTIKTEFYCESDGWTPSAERPEMTSEDAGAPTDYL
jgi:hypothetical protein